MKQENPCKLFTNGRFWFSWIWLSFSVALGQSADPSVVNLTLEGAVKRAIQANPLMEISRWEEEMADAQLQESGAGRLPELRFEETFTHSNNPVFAFGSLLEQGQFGPANFEVDSLNNPASLSNFRSSLNLRMPVFQRFQVTSAIRKAHLGKQQAQARTRRVEQEIRFRVIQSYFAVLVAEARKRVAGEAVQAAEADLKRIRDLHEQGLVVNSDVLAMEVQLSEFRQQQIQADGEMATAYAALNTVLAYPVTSRYSLPDGLEDRVLTLPSEQALIGTAFETRPELTQARLQVKMKQEEIRRARGQFLPDLNLFADYGLSGEDLASGSGDFAVGFRLTFDLVDLGREPRIRRASAALSAATAQERAAADAVTLELVQAYQSYQAAKDRLRVALGALDQSDETLRIVRDRYEVGLLTITEVLRAHTTLVRSEMNQLAARYDHHLSYAGTLLAAGTLNSVDSFIR